MIDGGTEDFDTDMPTAEHLGQILDEVRRECHRRQAALYASQEGLDDVGAKRRLLDVLVLTEQVDCIVCDVCLFTAGQ